MRRQDYYPGQIAAQAVWLDNFGQKLPTHGLGLGIDAADVTASVNDARWANYVLGSWLGSVRAFSPSTTDAVDDVLDGVGDGVTPVALPCRPSRRLDPDLRHRREAQTGQRLH